MPLHKRPPCREACAPPLCWCANGNRDSGCSQVQHRDPQTDEALSAGAWTLTASPCLQVPSACFTQPPAACVGLSEEAAKEQCKGEVDVYVSRFKPMRNVLSGRDEKNLIKMLVEVDTDKVLHQWLGPQSSLATG